MDATPSVRPDPVGVGINDTAGAPTRDGGSIRTATVSGSIGAAGATASAT